MLSFSFVVFQWMTFFGFFLFQWDVSLETMLFIVDSCPQLRDIWGLDLLMLSPASISAIQSHIRRNNRWIGKFYLFFFLSCLTNFCLPLRFPWRHVLRELHFLSHSSERYATKSRWGLWDSLVSLSFITPISFSSISLRYPFPEWAKQASCWGCRHQLLWRRRRCWIFGSWSHGRPGLEFLRSGHKLNFVIAFCK